MGKKSGPAAPPAPDPVATANAQKETNIASAISQANLNRIDQYTPQGSLTYSQKKNADGSLAFNADGTPQYAQTMSLNADEQKKYDMGNQVALALNGLAGSNIDRVKDAQSKPFTYDGMTPLQTGVKAGDLSGIADVGGLQRSLDYSKLTRLPGTEDFGAEAQRVAGSVYDQAASRLNPQFQQRESDMRARLAAQGISENSDAYRRDLDNEGRTRNDAFNQANYSAIQAGANEQSRIFGLAMSARQQGQNEANTQGEFANNAQGQEFQQAQARAAMTNANQNVKFNQDSANLATNNAARQQQIEEAAYLRNLPLNDIAALLGTGPGVADPNFNPVSQVGVAAPDYMGMVNNNYAQKMQQYNTQQQARSQMMGSIFGAAGSLGGAMMLSDRRFKENVRRIGKLANGLATYAFNYIGDKAQQFGVMAQEVLGIRPDAVQNINGVLHVDYGKVF